MNDNNIINGEINVLYLLAFSICLIAQDCEQRLNLTGNTFKQKQKQLFKGIIKDLTAAKIKHDELYKDYLETFGNNISRYDLEHRLANNISRLVLQYYDKCAAIPEKELEIDNIMKNINTFDIFDEDFINKFILKE